MPETTSQRRARLASYVPLCITARLRCGVITDGALPIDGALYFAQHRLAMGARTVSVPGAPAFAGDGAPSLLPLKRIGTTPIPGISPMPAFYYAASVAQWPAVVADGVDHWTKKLDTRYADLLAPQRARVPTSGGPYRAYRMPVAYRHALSVCWYVVGEPVEIRQLLSLVTHLGKKTAQGWGAVIDWTVAPAAADWSVTGPEGQLMRPIPDPAGVPTPIVPPYWLPRSVVPCRVPEGR